MKALKKGRPDAWGEMEKKGRGKWERRRRGWKIHMIVIIKPETQFWVNT